MKRTKQQGTSKICKCGGEKEDEKRRYCKTCGDAHSLVMHAAHVGKGTGKRK